MPEIPTLLIVVAAALVRADGAVLMQRRAAGREHGGLWEFPGGKVEAGETPKAALVRELAEELGITLEPAALAPANFAADETAAPEDGRRRVVILLYTCREWAGEPACLDGQEIGWFAPEALAALPMPPLDVPLAEALKKVI